MSSVPSAAELIHLGMDTSVKEIVAGVLRPGEEVPVISRIAGDEESVRRLIGRFPSGGCCRRATRPGPAGMAAPAADLDGGPVMWSPRR